MHPVRRKTLLFQPCKTKPASTQIAEQLRFGSGQRCRLSYNRGRLRHHARLMLRQGLLVHQQRLDIGKFGSGVSKHGQAFRVDIAPVGHLFALQPFGL